MARGNAPRRQLKWATTNLNASVISGGEALFDLNQVLAASQEEESTLVRTITCFQLVPVSPAGTSANQMLCGLGIGVASREGFDASAIADPSVSGEEPIQGWVWKCMYWVPENVLNGAEPVLIEKDLRAQRKIGKGVPFLKFSNDPGAGVAPFTMRLVGIVRTLYKLA